ncbi:hypothetical protein F5887DRAFT_1000167 [Amanita rubescens]|nr:hypothetical protein F5887DRAFT_1000167 [Amanita rubescens]
MSDFQSNRSFTPSDSLHPYRNVVLPPSLMPDFITLWCLVGDDPPFQVSVHRDVKVDFLKKAIKAETYLPGINASTLVLWMLNDPEPVDPEDTLMQRIRSRGDVATFAKRLPATQTMSALFPDRDPLDNHVHVLVRLPSTGPSWLVEIHNELWGKRDFFGKIFRTATLTKGDFTELQCHLDALNPKRNSDEYEAEDVLATKSAFLRERSTGLDLDLGDGLVPRLDASQPPSDNVLDDDVVDDDVVDCDVVDDDVVDDDIVDDDDDDAAMVIDSDHCSGDTHLPNEATGIFPYTIRYVDLTVLQSKKKLRVPRLMLFRNEWNTMIDIFNKRKKGKNGSALFSGQPGIGKTCMLYSILILCIILAQPIVFQDVSGKVFIIGNTVLPEGMAPGVSADADDVLALVDADDKVYQPNEYLFCHDEYRILLTSSPKKRKDRRWLTQRVNDQHAMFMMEPWSREELVVASLFLQSNDITLKRLQEASRICGNIPRECFAAAVSSRALDDTKAKIRKAIEQTKELSDTIITMTVDGGTVIHRVFQIRPLSKHRLWNKCAVEPVSDWAFSEMMVVLDQRRTFECHLHKFLKTSSRTFTIQSLDKRSTTHNIRFTPNTKQFGDMKCFTGELALSVQNKTSCYLQPLSPVFPPFDSFLYQPDISQFSPLVALQATTAADHPIKLKGLEDVQTSLKPKVSGMKDLRPTTKRKMIILFVVPDTLGVPFAKQTIEGAKKGAQTLWYGKTDQYILALSEAEVFGAK